MKPSDIYNLPDIGNEYNRKDIYLLSSGWHNHLPELPDLDTADLHELPAGSPVEIRLHVNPYIDGERCMTVGSVWFDKQPVMIFRHAGRSGHDDYDRFITNEELFFKMIGYLRGLIPDEEGLREVCDPNEDIADLDWFYGTDIKKLVTIK